MLDSSPSVVSRSASDSPGDKAARTRVSVVIPTFQRTDQLNQLIEQVASGTLAPDEIIVVNNDPVAPTVIRADVAVPLQVIEAGLGLNIAGARNRGWRASVGDLCLFIDDDNTVAADMLEQLVDAARNSRYGLLGPVIYSGSHPTSVWCAGVIRSMWTTRTTYNHGGVELAEGGRIWPTENMPDAFMIRREALDLVSGFDEEEFPFHYEEADIGARIRQAGWEAVVVGDARCWHHGNVARNPAVELSRAFALSGSSRLKKMVGNRIVFHYRHGRGASRVVALGAGVPGLLVVTVAMLVAEPTVKASSLLDIVRSLIGGAVDGYRRCVRMQLAGFGRLERRHGVVSHLSEDEKASVLGESPIGH